MEPLEIMNPVVNLSLYGTCNRNTALLLIAGLFSFINTAAQQHSRGLVFENDRYNHLPLGSAYGRMEPLPSSATLKPYLGRVITQSNANTAVAWSAAWYASAILQAKHLEINDENLIKNFHLAPAFTYRDIQGNHGCSEPASLIDALESLKLKGSPRFSDFREFCVESIPAFAIDSAKSHRLPGYARLFNTYDPREIKVQAVMRAIQSGSPVILGIICPPSFQLAGEFWQPREKEPLPEYGGHAVTVVGYDDNKFGGAFEIVNSWGKGWGREGMSWFRYDDFTAYTLYGFQMLKVPGKLDVTVDFFLNSGNFMNVARDGNGLYRFLKDYQTGEQFRIRINSKNPVFASVLAIDPSGQQASLFPKDSTVHPMMDSRLLLPDEIGAYPLTEPKGKNVIFLLFSSTESSLEVLIQKIRTVPDFTPPESRLTKWENGRIKFESMEEAIAIRVELNQL